MMIHWFEQVDSTNTRLMEQVRLDPQLPSGTIWAARSQTAGRGRMERKWVSASGVNLLFSLYYRSAAELCRLPALTMAMAIAIDEMLHGFNIQSNLKWPNDVQVGGRKISGLLAERAGSDGVVIGVGLNINMTEAELAQIDQPATSLRVETGREWGVAEVLEILIHKHFSGWLARWEASGFAGLRERWLQGCGGLHAPLTVRDGASRIQGTLAGFGENGELLLRLPDDTVQTVWAGDISGSVPNRLARQERTMV
jgi:BirA family biotin operon repressor/biotin-[acetyl-CoA-carboxylase] ligase